MSEIRNNETKVLRHGWPYWLNYHTDGSKIVNKFEILNKFKGHILRYVSLILWSITPNATPVITKKKEMKGPKPLIQYELICQSIISFVCFCLMQMRKPFSTKARFWCWAAALSWPFTSVGTYAHWCNWNIPMCPFIGCKRYAFQWNNCERLTFKKYIYH